MKLKDINEKMDKRINIDVYEKKRFLFAIRRRKETEIYTNKRSTRIIPIEKISKYFGYEIVEDGIDLISNLAIEVNISPLKNED